MLKRCVMVFGAWLIALPLVAMGADAAEQLRSFVNDVHAATGKFSQSVLTESGDAGGVSQQGSFSFERPGRFKWLVQQPFEQLTLSDGTQLYQYDPDLAQVIVRDIDDSVGASPAAILFGSGKLDDSFVLTALPQDDGLDWLRAQPRSPDAGFVHVDIGFRSGIPERLLLLDSFGQTSRIDLNDMVVNPQLAADEFVFTPPADADVVHMQGQ